MKPSTHTLLMLALLAALASSCTQGVPRPTEAERRAVEPIKVVWAASPGWPEVSLYPESTSQFVLDAMLQGVLAGLPSAGGSDDPAAALVGLAIVAGVAAYQSVAPAPRLAQPNPELHAMLEADRLHGDLSAGVACAGHALLPERFKAPCRSMDAVAGGAAADNAATTERPTLAVGVKRAELRSDSGFGYYVRFRAHARLMESAVPMDATYERDLVYRSRQRPLDEWLKGNGALLAAEWRHARDVLAQRIVEEWFLVVTTPEDHEGGIVRNMREFMGKPEICGLTPADRLLNVNPKQPMASVLTSSRPAHPPTLDVVPGAREIELAWAAFPNTDVLPDRSLWAGVSNVTYEVRVWSVGNIDTPEPVVDIKGLREPAYRLTGITPDLVYRWSVRARYRQNGAMRVLPWTHAAVTDQRGVPGMYSARMERLGCVYERLENRLVFGFRIHEQRPPARSPECGSALWRRPCEPGENPDPGRSADHDG